MLFNSSNKANKQINSIETYEEGVRELVIKYGNDNDIISLFKQTINDIIKRIYIRLDNHRRLDLATSEETILIIVVCNDKCIEVFTPGLGSNDGYAISFKSYFDQKNIAPVTSKTKQTALIILFSEMIEKELLQIQSNNKEYITVTSYIEKYKMQAARSTIYHDKNYVFYGSSPSGSVHPSAYLKVFPENHCGIKIHFSATKPQLRQI